MSLESVLEKPVPSTEPVRSLDAILNDFAPPPPATRSLDAILNEFVPKPAPVEQPDVPRETTAGDYVGEIGRSIPRGLATAGVTAAGGAVEGALDVAHDPGPKAMSGALKLLNFYKPYKYKMAIEAVTGADTDELAASIDRFINARNPMDKDVLALIDKAVKTGHKSIITNIPVTPGFENSWTRKITEGGMSFVPAIGASFIGGPAGLSTFAAATGYGSMFRTAMELTGGDVDASRDYARMQAIVGAASEPVLGAAGNVVRTFKRLDKAAGGWLSKVVRGGFDTLKTGTGEGIQEAVEEIPVEVARQAYQEERTLIDSLSAIAEAGILGGIVGTIFGGFSSGLKAIATNEDTGSGADPNQAPQEPGELPKAPSQEMRGLLRERLGRKGPPPADRPRFNRKLAALAEQETVSRKAYAEATGAESKDIPPADVRMAEAQAEAAKIDQDEPFSTITDQNEPISPQPEPETSRTTADLTVDNALTANQQATIEKMRPRQVQDRLRVLYEENESLIKADQALMEGDAFLASGEREQIASDKFIRPAYSFANSKIGRDKARELKRQLPKNLKGKVTTVSASKEPDGEAVMDAIGTDRMAEAIIRLAGRGRRQNVPDIIAEFILANPDKFGTQTEAAMLANKHLGQKVTVKPRTTIDTMVLQEGDTVQIQGETFTVGPINPESDTVMLMGESGREIASNVAAELTIDQGSYSTAIKGTGRGVTVDLLGQPETDKTGQTKLLTEEEIDNTRLEAFASELPKPKPIPVPKPVADVEGQQPLTFKDKAAAAKAEADAIFAQLEREGQTLFSGGIDREKWALFVRGVRARLRQGAYTMADFLAELAERFSQAMVDRNRAQLQQIYEDAVDQESGPDEAATPPPAGDGPRTSGESKKPRNRANPFTQPLSRELADRLEDERNQRGEWDSTDEEKMDAAATARVTANYQGELESIVRGDLLERVAGAGVDSLVVRQVLDTELQQSLLNEDQDRLSQAAMGEAMYRRVGTELSIGLSSRRDKAMNPKQRMAAAAARLLNEPPPAIRREMDKAITNDRKAMEQARRASGRGYSRPSGSRPSPTSEAPTAPGRPVPAPGTRRKSGKVRKAEESYRKAQDELNDYLDRSGQTLGTAGGNVDTKAIALLGKVALQYIKLRGRQLEGFIADLTDRFGEATVRRLAREIIQAWNAAVRQADQANIVPVDPGPFRTGAQAELTPPLDAPPVEPFRTGLQPDLRPDQALNAPPVTGSTTGPQGRLVEEPAVESPGDAARKTTGEQQNFAGMNNLKPLADKWARQMLARKAYLVARSFDVEGVLAGTADPIHAGKLLNELQAINNDWDNAHYEYWRNMLLFGPQTFIRNSLAILNVVNELTFKKMLTAGLDTSLRLFRKDHGGARFGELVEGLKGFIQSGADAKVNFLLSYDTEKPMFDAWAARAGDGRDMSMLLDAAMAHMEAHPPAISGTRFKRRSADEARARAESIAKNEGRKGEAAARRVKELLDTKSSEAWLKEKISAGRTIRLPFRIQGATDQMIKTGMGAGTVRALAYRQATNEGLRGKDRSRRMVKLMRDPASQPWVDARMEAHRATFTEEGGPAMKKISSALSLPGVRLIVPFHHTGGNLLKWFARYFPGTSIFNVGMKLHKSWREGEVGRLTPAVAEAMLGWAALMGIAATNDPEDPWITGRRHRTKPYTLFPNSSTPLNYQWIQPFSSTIGALVDLVDAIRTKDVRTVLSEPITSISDQLEHYPMFVGISDMMKALYYSKKDGAPNLPYIARWMGRFAASHFPGGNLTKSVVEATKDYVPNRRISSDPEAFIRNLGRVTAQQTGVGSLIFPDIPKRTIWGEVIPKDGSFLPFAGTDILFRLLSPIQEQRMPETIGDRIINNWNLFNRTKPAYLPDEPNNYWEVNGKTIYLNRDQVNEYQELAGRKSLELLTKRLAIREDAGRPVKPEQPTDKDLELVKDSLEDGRRMARQELKRKWGMR